MSKQNARNTETADTNIPKVDKALTGAQLNTLRNLKTKSGWIRYLLSLGYQVKDVVRIINHTVLEGKKPMRYQHVRNVKEQKVKTPTERF